MGKGTEKADGVHGGGVEILVSDMLNLKNQLDIKGRDGQ